LTELHLHNIVGSKVLLNDSLNILFH